MVVDLGGLIRSLVEGDVRFVVIGGIAVVAHQLVRSTEDLDIVPEPSEENLTALGNTLARLDARLLADPERGIDPALRLSIAQGKTMSFSTPLGDLDVVQRLPGVPGYRELEADAWGTSLFGTPFLVCSRDHLIAMKRARGSALDQADLELLDP